MAQKLSFNQAVEYLNAGFNYAASGQSGVVTLRNASQVDCLILQSEDAGDRTSLFAPFLERPESLDIQKQLDLRLLHLNGDLDTLGSLRISLNHDTNQYSLCDGVLYAESLESFTEYLQAVLKMANYLRSELTDVLDNMLQGDKESLLELNSHANDLKA